MERYVRALACICSNRREAVVDEQVRAVDEARFVAGQE